jgi:hypothetical protein
MVVRQVHIGTEDILGKIALMSPINSRRLLSIRQIGGSPLLTSATGKDSVTLGQYETWPQRIFEIAVIHRVGGPLLILILYQISYKRSEVLYVHFTNGIRPT